MPPTRREALEALVLLAAPMMPHLAEDCWQALGHDRLVAETPWPKYDPALLVSDTVTIAVQVNGKRRGEIRVARGADNKTVEAAALALDGVVARSGRQRAEESDRRAQPHREHRRMKQACSSPALALPLAGRLRLSSAVWRRHSWSRSWRPSMSSRWPSATAMNCAIS